MVMRGGRLAGHLWLVWWPLRMVREVVPAEDQARGGFGGVVGEVGQHAGVGVGGDHECWSGRASTARF